MSCPECGFYGVKAVSTERFVYDIVVTWRCLDCGIRWSEIKVLEDFHGV